MRSYQFLNDLFKSVLLKSKGIRGRFHVSAKGGLELNTDQVGELIKDLVIPDIGQKYPLAMMMPPRSIGYFTEKTGDWERYQVAIYFLKTTHYDGNNQINNINPNTQTSQHTVLQDWHDMKRCALGFLQVLTRIEKGKGLINNQFRLGQQERQINPVSFIGIDRAAGVRLDFSCSLFIGCNLFDYSDGDIATITVPAEDPHPEHNM